MSEPTKMITTEECGIEIKLMARRTALLYYFFASTLIEEFGEEEGKRLIARAIEAYGRYCGQAIRDALESMGLPLTEENFDKIPDLPRYGWETGTKQTPDGQTHATATYCPLAATWKEMGQAAEKLGRLYCFVDQAKQAAYNPDFVFVHEENLLDGDPCCEFCLKPALH